MRALLLVVLLLSVLPFSLGTGDGAGPSRPAAAEDPVSIRAASLSSNIAQCESTVAAADRVLMDSSATGEARHALGSFTIFFHEGTHGCFGLS